MTDSTYTHLALVVDRSGSMHAIKDDMNGAIATLIGEQAKRPGTLRVDVTLFDTEIEQPYLSAAPSEIPAVLIRPRGGTALLDAMGQAITSLGERLAALPEQQRPATVIVAVVTDGQENSSKDWASLAIKELVERQSTEWSWRFVFLGANIDSFSVAGSLGFARGSTMNYTANAAGVRGMSLSLSDYVTRVRSGGDASFTTAEREAATDA